MLLVRTSVARSAVESESGASHSFFLAVLEVASIPLETQEPRQNEDTVDPETRSLEDARITWCRGAEIMSRAVDLVKTEIYFLFFFALDVLPRIRA